MSETKKQRKRILILSSFALKLELKQVKTGHFFSEFHSVTSFDAASQNIDGFWLPGAKSFLKVYYMNVSAEIFFFRFYTQVCF